MSLSPTLMLFTLERQEILDMFRKKLESADETIEKLQAAWEVEPMGAIREDMKGAIEDIRESKKTLTFMRDHLRKDGWPHQLSAMHLLEVKAALKPYDAKALLGEGNLIVNPQKAIQDFQHNVQGRPPRW